jgi:hypothetical protein
MTPHDETPTAQETNVTIRVYDAATAPTLSDAREATPLRKWRRHNTTRAAYHEAVVSALAGTAPDLEVDALALGDSETSTSDLATMAAVGNETFRTDVTDARQSGQTFRATIFLDSTEANGQTYREAALVAEQADGSDLPVNHVIIDDPGGLLDPKSAGETVTIDIDISQQDA